jgi:hypothetical protein
MGQHFRVGRRDHLRIAAGVVAMFVGVENLGD